jgi:drug/metabolite transporter (DMT)-like permease
LSVLATAAVLTGAIGYGVGSVLQAWAATRAHGPVVVLHRAYLAGLGCDAVAWLSSLLALRTLPLFSVQAALAGSVAVTVVLAHVTLNDPLLRRDVLATAVVVASIVVVLAAAGRQSSAPAPEWFGLATGLAVPLVAIVLVGVYRRGTLLLATVAGLAFSGAAVCARSLAGIHLGPGLLLRPLVWALAAFGLLGALAYARSLERGPVGPATAVLWLVEVIVPGVLGVAALGDRVRPGWAVPAGVAVVVAVLACITMSLRPSSAAPA